MPAINADAVGVVFEPVEGGFDALERFRFNLQPRQAEFVLDVGVRGLCFVAHGRQIIGARNARAHTLPQPFTQLTLLPLEVGTKLADVFRVVESGDVRSWDSPSLECDSTSTREAPLDRPSVHEQGPCRPAIATTPAPYQEPLSPLTIPRNTPETSGWRG